MGKINCPMLLVNGLDDQNWATVEFSDDVSTHTHTQLTSKEEQNIDHITNTHISNTGTMNVWHSNNYQNT